MNICSVRNNSPSRSGRRVSSQRGVFMPLLGIGLLVLLGVVAFAIDLPQKEVISQELRLAMDAASLGGAQQLDGTNAGMRKAVAVVDTLMSKNRVAGSPLTMEQYRIEFGFYSFPDKKFIPLADGGEYRIGAGESTGSSMSEASPLYAGVPVKAITNAVRVLAHTTAPSIFSSVLGFFNLGELSNNSVATANRNPKVCAFPFAIPLCSLFVNQDPHRTDQVMSESYEAERQCKRPVFATNANFAFEHHAQLERAQGLTRASAYFRPERITYSGMNLCGASPGSTGSNCLSGPIIGTFIAPQGRDLNNDGELDGDGSSSGTVSRVEFQRMLSTMNALPPKADRGACIDFQIGESVSPLEYLDVGSDDPSGGSSIMVPEDVAAADAVDDLMANMITGRGSRKFTEVFGDPRVTSGAHLPRPNYPYLRDQPVDRTLGYGNVRTVAPSMGPWQWTNPLCHSDRIAANDLENARALPVVVPVIIPGVTRIGGRNTIHYCDPASEVGNDPMVTSDTPRGYTKPQIVGFVEVDLFDFNFRWLPDENLTFPAGSGAGGSFSGAGFEPTEVRDSNPLGGKLCGR